MLPARLPVLFVSHGAPDLLLNPGPTLALWDALGRWFNEHLPPIRAILAISAHWQAAAPTVGTAMAPATLHDFSGFDAALTRITYPAIGDPALAEALRQRLWDAGMAAATDPQRGLDHGIWAPLSRLFPHPDRRQPARIPIVPLALTRGAGPDWHHQLGRLLRPLRRAGVLILASGAVTHNLRRCQNLPAAAHASDPAAAAFADWLAATLQQPNATARLLDYRQQAPHAALMHPDEEHLLPLFVALGAAEADLGETNLADLADAPGRPPQRLVSGTTLGTLVMDSYLWHDQSFLAPTDPAEPRP